MVQRKPTPEEQLLKLIENPDAGPQAGTPAKPGASKKTGRGASFSFGKLPGFLDYFKNSFGSKKSSGGVALSVDIKSVNKVLVLLVFVSVIYLFVDLLFLKSGQADFLSQVGTSDPVYPLMESDAGQEPLELASYMNTLRTRNPFLPPPAPQDMVVTPEEEFTAQPSQSEGGLTDALQGLKLVGVSWAKEPLAMIEDIATGKTYFVRRGQEVKGVKIQTVLKEKVVVTYNGQEGELF